jgi:predicted methyltransferase
MTYTTHEGQRVQLRDVIVDYKAALTIIKKALKKDDVFIIIDHSVKPSSGYEVANTFHRIDQTLLSFS